MHLNIPNVITINVTINILVNINIHININIDIDINIYIHVAVLTNGLPRTELSCGSPSSRTLLERVRDVVALLVAVEHFLGGVFGLCRSTFALPSDFVGSIHGGVFGLRGGAFALPSDFGLGLSSGLFLGGVFGLCGSFLGGVFGLIGP